MNEQSPNDSQRTLFREVRVWVFDLDNTLYHPSHGLFDQIDAKMTEFIARRLGVSAAEADALRARYWRDYGTTLAGLMDAHRIDPTEYLDEVHDIDVSHIPAATALGAAIAALPGRKLVYTNGSRGHAENVLGQLEIRGAFEAVYGIEDSDYQPKPARAAFERVFDAAAVRPETAAMFEDTARNLEAPFAMGMRTVWMRNDHPHGAEGADGPHIDVVVDDLVDFLRRLVG